jgi:hypothetical protein
MERNDPLPQPRSRTMEPGGNLADQLDYYRVKIAVAYFVFISAVVVLGFAHINPTHLSCRLMKTAV